MKAKVNHFLENNSEVFIVDSGGLSIDYSSRVLKDDGKTLSVDFSERPNISEEDRLAMLKMCRDFMAELRGMK